MGKFESSIQSACIRWLDAQPMAQAVVFHGSPYTKAGTPDIIGCWYGRAFVAEIKNEQGELSKIQIEVLKRWARCGAAAFAIRSRTELIEHLNEIPI